MKNQHLHTGTSSGIRSVAWLNIGIQAVLPLTLALATPSASAASGTEPAKEAQAPTRLHTFVMGDTLASIATHYTTTIATLRTLNPGRDLDVLKPGDRLSVPSAPTHTLPDLNSPGQEATAQAEDEQARKLAAMASDTGNFLSSNPDGDAAASMARGLATSEASGQAQAWLSRFGTARVQVDVDDKLSLKNSQVELLVPLHDTPEQLLFTQGSVHRKDDRQQTSLGLGVRRFNDSYMLGANSFLDHDLSRGHSRLGLGVEYWRDFLKVNANSYQRLTGWKDSPDVEDYQERPANGWDIRTEAWLPTMPQLGGKLTYEQYYGDEVGLFGKDNRKKDPSAVTVGLTYTPIPLLTFSADQRKGNGGNETTVGAEFNYRLGEAWARQVDPAGVGALRTLAGSRYDLVERNNHIVLEYRKKQVIQMAAAAHITGQAGETKSLSVWVNSKHPLSHIDWTAPALLQAGGSIAHDGGPNYSVVLPAYQTGAQHTNVYTLHGVAVDSRGNRSARSETRVTVNAPALSIGYSTFTPADTVLKADGVDHQTLTLVLLDEQKQPVDVALSDIQIIKDQVRAGTLADDITVSEPTRTSPGVYEILVTAGRAEQTVALTPTVQGTALAQAQVSTVNTLPDEGKSTFTALPPTVPADDKTLSLLTFTAKDANDSPITGLEDALKLIVTNDTGKPPAPNDVTVGPFAENGKTGVYTATVKGRRAGIYALTPQVRSEAMDRLKIDVTLTSLPPAETHSTLTLAQSTLVADDFTTNAVNFKVRNALQGPITGIANQISFDITDRAGRPASTSIEMGSLRERNPGEYTAEFVGITPGDYLMTPKINGIPMNSRTVPFNLLTSRIEYLRTYGDYLFPRSSGFPTTAYQEATFITVLANNVPNDLFTWRSSVSWLTFQPPYFVFTGAPPTDSGHVTITATSKGGNIVHTYDFKITKWYELSKLGASTDWSAAMTHCASLSLSPVSKAEATKGENVRGIGTVASEWGAVQGGGAHDLWLSDPAGSGKYLRLSNGHEDPYGAVIETPGSERYRSMCSRTLK